MHGIVSVILTEYFHKAIYLLFNINHILAKAICISILVRDTAHFYLVLYFVLILKLLYIKKKVNCIGCFYLLTFLYTVERSHYYFYMNQ